MSGKGLFQREELKRSHPNRVWIYSQINDSNSLGVVLSYRLIQNTGWMKLNFKAQTSRDVYTESEIGI